MKKLIMTVAVLACASSVFSADAVTSANVVGYSKTTIVASQFQMRANQFVGADEVGVTIGEAFGTSLPDASELYIWNGNSYDAYSFFGGTWYDSGFGDAGGVVIARGDALWVKNGGGSSVDQLFSGNVPASGTTTNALVSGFNMVANPYPTAVQLSQLDIGAIDADELYIFSGTYTAYSYFGGTWYDSGFGNADNVEIPVGTGFWYNTPVARDWVVTIPYSL